MEETFNEKGVIVIIVSLATATLLLLGAYFLSFSVTESKISKSQEIAAKTYYLAEAGINEAIWKLKNDEIVLDGDDSWKICFATSSAECLSCDSWQDTFSRNYTENSTTTVTIQNSQCAKGTIIATTTLFLAGGKTSQRVVKIKVLKSYGSLTEDSPIFSGYPSGESTVQSSVMNVHNGNIFSNNNFNIKHWSTVNVYDATGTQEQEGKILANQNINLTWSTLNASATCAKNMCTPLLCEKCPVDSIEMPAIDFDSVSPSSYKSKAQNAQTQGQCDIVGKNFSGETVTTTNKCLFSGSEFENILWEVGCNGVLILKHKANSLATSTYYVTGGVDLKGGRRLEINGVLVADGTVNVGESFCWTKSGRTDCGFDQLTINDPGMGAPSGFLTKGKMNFGLYSSFQEVSVVGLIYSQDEMRLTSVPYSFNVTGGIIARKFTLSSAWSSLNIYLNNDIIREGVWGEASPPGGITPPYSPVVTIEHWEETY